MTPTFVDFESRSRCDLRVHGGRLYWSHPSTEVLCAVLHGDAVGGRLEWWPSLGPLFGPGDILPMVAAHNAMGFDAFAWRALGWPEPRRWVDTAPLARRAGLPGALAALAALVGHDVKDKEGSRLTVGLSTVRRPTRATAHLSPLAASPEWDLIAAAFPGRPGKRLPTRGRTVVPVYEAGGLVRGEVPAELWADLDDSDKREWGVQAVVTPAILARVVAYCGKDVDALVDAWPLLEPFLDAEPAVERADRAVNDRGIGFDRELARALLDIDSAQARAACAGVGLAPTELRSPARFCAHIAQAGGFAPDATFETVEALTRVPGRVGALAEARLALASIARGKLEAGLARTSEDGRLRDSMRYCGAHTWRWAHTGLQPGNIPWINRRPDV